ncbi:MAG: hypothetical protein DSZ35_10635 [Verrucomicrobia bacterium]|nr:MAG: hypothetical protein DSZ35_10635 [Verrucomicrobiota bacterium]
MNLARGCLALGLLAWIAPCLAMAEEGPWRWSNPQPHGNSIRAIAKGDDFSIEVGDNGSIHTSQNMVQWFPRASGVELTLRAAVFFKEQAIVAGDDGTLLYSESEEQFEPGVLDKPSSGNFRALAASGQLIVAGGDDGTLYTSTDGRKWRRRTFKYSNHIHALIWTGNYFVAVGEGGLVATSTNGSSWTKRQSRTNRDLNALAYVNKRLWTVGDDGVVLLSYNEGVSWLAASAGTDKNLNAVTGTASEVIVAGENVVRKGVLDFFMYWVDLLGNDEGANPSPPPDWTYYCAIELDDKFLLGGRTGMLVDSVRDEEDDEYLYWFTGDDSVRNWLWDINRVGDLMVAVGDHATVLTSRDGASWNLEVAPESATKSILLGVGGTTNLLVAVGNHGQLLTSHNSWTNVVTKNDLGQAVTNRVNTLGVVWEAVDPKPTVNDLQGVAALGETWVVTGGKGTVLTTSDGKKWNKHQAPTTGILTSVEAFKGRFVATGEDGVILTSPNGADWTGQTSGTAEWIYRVRAFDGQLVAVGQAGTLLTSTDGDTWARRESGTGQWLNDVTRVGDAWYVVGANGTVLTSPDLESWQAKGTITGLSLYGALANDGQLLAVGLEGIILRKQIVPRSSPILILWERAVAADGEITNNFGFRGFPGQRFSLDRSPDLKTWEPGPNLELLDGSGVLEYSNTTRAAREFYRAKLR